MWDNVITVRDDSKPQPGQWPNYRKGESMNFNLGEKIEAIIMSRKSGAYGKYLGSSAQTFGACEIDGQIYKVSRKIEPPSNWTVNNVTCGISVTIEGDRWDLASIKESHFER